MPCLTRRIVLLGMAFGLAACGDTRLSRRGAGHDENPPLFPNETPALRRLINSHADRNKVPRALVHKVVLRESSHNPAARNRSYFGLMQISAATARTMGFRGKPQDLLDADTNLTYAVKYLRGAWLVAGGDHDAAVGWYARGYYYEAKRLGLLAETGLKT